MTATVRGDHISLNYRVTDLDIDGSDGWGEDNLDDWSDTDIKNVAGSMLGIVQEDRRKIKVEYD